MNLDELYSAIEGNYDAVIELMITPERVSKYLAKFLNNTDYDNLLSSLANSNFADAFRYVHNLKGMSANMAFTKLKNSSSELCEALRNGPPSIDIAPLLDAVKTDYELTTSFLKQYLNQ